MPIQRPSVRLKRIMERISRSAWIMPNECEILSQRIAKRICPQSWVAVKGTMRDECFHVGMIGARPVAYSFDREAYRFVLDLVEKNISTEKKLIELLKYQQTRRIV